MSTLIMKSFLPKRDYQTLRDDSISVSKGIIDLFKYYFSLIRSRFLVLHDNILCSYMLYSKGDMI